MLEHEGANLLAMHAQSLDRTRTSTNKIAHRLMALVGHPHRGQFAGPQELGKRHSIAAVRLHPVARLPWDERGRHDRAGMPERRDEPVQTIAGRAGLVAEMRLAVLGRDPLNQAAHALLGGVHLAEIAHLAPTLAIGDRDGVARLRDIGAQTTRILSSAEKCRRVARRISRTTSVLPALSPSRISVFLFHLEGYDEPEIFPFLTRPICLIGADGEHQILSTVWARATG